MFNNKNHLGAGRGLNSLDGIYSASVTSFTNSKSLLLDGISKYINIDNVLTALSATTVGTISFWIKVPLAIPVALRRLISFGDTNANEFLTVFLDNNGKIGIALGIAGATQFNVRTDNVVLTNATWAHLAFTQNATQPKIYVNGSLVAQTNIISTNLTKWFNASTGLDNGRIGALNFNSGGNTGFLNGNITKFLFVNRALSAGEVTTLYNSGVPKDESGITNGVSQFIIDGDTVPTMTDSIGSNNGTYVNCVQGDIVTDAP